jgi:[ribosomal protein S5]-alanine N-acetyltransferase
MEECIPQFRTERLLLRELNEADAKSYEKHFADYEVVRWLTRAVPWPYPAGGVRGWIREQVLPVQGRDRGVGHLPS